VYDGLDAQKATVSWHLQVTYADIEPPVQVITRVALTDASLDAGCLPMIPSSHRLG
jgi:non-haem Fe2+, alpha-ketoglutarate-dependent halogenase